ncbi:hypothetical protein LSUE1_G010253 [Lachnellula suecica]|uniref:Uncharacterized protein n=1 Tax=Lachnellula suecica TaxID=602035 RepID=A0A8T9BQ98_9HELO|nr:hypothetical protein LSUE1_G010253 [Lachnellula suecica]
MSNNDRNSPPADGPPRPRRSSVTQQTFNNIFGGRSNSTAGAPTAPFPGPITTAAAQDQRRRMSISTLGLSGTSPTQNNPFPFGARRASVSTAGSDSIDESAIDDEDGPARTPATPFTRRISFGAQALRRAQPNGSPGTNGRSPSYTTTKPSSTLPSIPSGPRSEQAVAQAQARARSGSSTGGGTTPPKAQNQASMQSKPRTASDYPVSARPAEGGGFNWSEQLRSRAESSVSQSQRPNFSTSPSNKQVPLHERQKSVSEMPAPPTAAPVAPKPARKQPDAFQERILKGDFYMD